MTANLSFTYREYSGKQAGCQFNVAEIAADGTNWAGINTATDALVTAINAAIVGELAQQTISQPTTLTLTLPGNTGQRGKKWLISYHDSVTLKRYSNEIPGADDSILTNNSDVGWTPAKTDIAVLVTLADKLDDLLESPDGNPIVMDKIEYVNRTL